MSYCDSDFAQTFFWTDTHIDISKKLIIMVNKEQKPWLINHICSLQLHNILQILPTKKNFRPIL